MTPSKILGATAMTGIPTSAGLEAGAVKALEWHLSDDGERWTADRPYGEFIIVRDHRASAETTHGWFNEGRWLWFPSFEAAKAVAQADFEARIRSALAAAPGGANALPAVEIHPADTLPSGDDYLISKAFVHEGAIIALYGTNDKLIGWIDTNAWTKGRVYRDQLLPSSAPSPTGTAEPVGDLTPMSGFLVFLKDMRFTGSWDLPTLNRAIEVGETIAAQAVAPTEEVERNTHLLDWLADGHTHCQHGTKEWCEGYLHNARDVIKAHDTALTALSAKLEEARKALWKAHNSIVTGFDTVGAIAAIDTALDLIGGGKHA